MRLFICSLAVLLLVGCGSGLHGGPNVVDPAFQPLYNEFMSDAKAAGLNLSENMSVTIQFADLGQKTSLGETIGECSNVGIGFDTIQIDSTFWNEAMPDAQQILLYHELGHCMLGENHVTDPEAIMYPVINQPMGYYYGGWSLMLSQFFQNRNI